MVFRFHRKEEDVCIREMGAAHLSLSGISKSFGNVTAVSDLTLEIKRGEFFSFLGPSGCGKTTVLRLIAGLEKPDRGDITIDDRIIAGRAWIPPEKRRVGIVFQDYALFPHLTVFKNVAFGLRGCTAWELRKKVMEMLALAGLADMSQRYPHQLSGGEQQRVALARALAPSPKVLLLDEPFSSLDADLRSELRTETKRIQKEMGITTLLVTHDQEEAFSLSERVGVLKRGRLQQIAPPDEIYHKPTNRFVADFVGRSDFIRARIEGENLISEIGIFSLNSGFSGGSKNIPERFFQKEVELLVRPDDVDFTIEPDGDVEVRDAQFLGPQIIYKLLLPDGKSIYSIRHSAERIPVGTRVRIKVDPSHIVIFSEKDNDDE